MTMYVETAPEAVGKCCDTDDLSLFDFESGTWAGWTVEGGAFGDAPYDAQADVPEWREDRAFRGWQGRYIAKIGDSRHKGASPSRLISDPFVINRDYLTFRLGAEVNPGVFVALEVEGAEIARAYGNNAYDLRLRGWDVRQYQGKTARLLVVVQSKPAVLLRVDDFRLTNTPPPPVYDFAESRPQECDIVRYGEMRPLVTANDAGGGVVFHTSLIKGHDDRWHLLGSVGSGTYAPQERIFHATASRIDGPYTVTQTHAVVPDPTRGERFVREPFVLFHENRYYLFYVGSGDPWEGWEKGTQGPYGIHLAVSDDGETWERVGDGPLFTDFPFAFTPFVRRVGDRWVMYYAGAEPAALTGMHGIFYRTSTDLVQWGERFPALVRTNMAPWAEHSFVHSPQVFERKGTWYLLCGPMGNANQSRFHYRQLFASNDPFHWDAPPTEHSPLKGLFLEGGAKFVTDDAKRQWVTHSGPWAAGVWIAPLHWRDDQLDTQKEETR